jgi:quercetin dioxygenase-like cupin family protein
MSRTSVKTMRFMATTALIVGSLLAQHTIRAQPAGITRTDLQRHDLSVPGREAIQVRVDLEPGAAFPKHSHPGEEIIYVL